MGELVSTCALLTSFINGNNGLPTSWGCWEDEVALVKGLDHALHVVRTAVLAVSGTVPPMGRQGGGGGGCRVQMGVMGGSRSLHFALPSAWNQVSGLFLSTDTFENWAALTVGRGYSGWD